MRAWRTGLWVNALCVVCHVCGLDVCHVNNRDEEYGRTRSYHPRRALKTEEVQVSLVNNIPVATGSLRLTFSKLFERHPQARTSESDIVFTPEDLTHIAKEMNTAVQRQYLDLTKDYFPGYDPHFWHGIRRERINNPKNLPSLDEARHNLRRISRQRDELSCARGPAEGPSQAVRTSIVI
jgi:hypothetical protein